MPGSLVRRTREQTSDTSHANTPSHVTCTSHQTLVKVLSPASALGLVIPLAIRSLLIRLAVLTARHLQDHVDHCFGHGESIRSETQQHDLTWNIGYIKGHADLAVFLSFCHVSKRTPCWHDNLLVKGPCSNSRSSWNIP
jgi:hypothetical protein